MRSFYDLHSALAQPLAVEALHLDRNQLQEVSESILAFKNLRLLNLSANQLTDLPAWIDRFPKLQTLDLSKNQFEKLPEVLGNCFTLEILNLQKNHLEEIQETGLPTSLFQLNLSENHLRKFQLRRSFPKLKVLRLDQNSLTTFPTIKNAPALKDLNLYQNKIKAWSKLKQINEGLEKLNLGRNSLKSIPDDIGRLKDLKYLDLSKNKLAELPRKLGDCHQLRNLNLAGNRLPKLPASFESLSWLVDLDLSENSLERLPKVLQNLQRLDRLDLSRNELGSKLKYPFPEALRVLDLSHNPIKTIVQLPPQLKQLSLRKMNLTSFKFFRQLGVLEHLDFRLSRLNPLPESLFYLSRLKQLKGLLPSGPKKHLLQLLETELSPREKKDLYDFWYEKMMPNQAVLWKGLSLSIPTLSKKLIAHLLQQTQARYPSLPGDIKNVRLLGRLTTAKTVLSPKMKMAGIQITEDSPWCILGRGPFPVLKSGQTYCFFNEAQFLKLLEEKCTSKGQQLSQSQNAKLERLLLHPNPRQVKMAFLLIQGDLVDPSLLPALITAWKSQVDPKLKRQLSDLIQQNQHTDYAELRNRKLPGLDLETIFQWLESAGLDRKDYQHWETFFEKR